MTSSRFFLHDDNRGPGKGLNSRLPGEVSLGCRPGGERREVVLEWEY